MDGWNNEHAIQCLGPLLRGLRLTVFSTVVGFGLALVIALVWTAMRLSGRPALKGASAAIVEFLRGTPLLIQLYVLYFVIFQSIENLSALAVGVVGLGLHYSAYCAEIYRAGLDAVPRGQAEACRALGLGPIKTFRHVLLPQALTRAVPALGNAFIAMFKDTPMLYAIAVTELLSEAKQYGSEHYRFLEPITMAGLFFLILSLLAAGLVRLAEHKLPVRHA